MTKGEDTRCFNLDSLSESENNSIGDISTSTQLEPGIYYPKKSE